MSAPSSRSIYLTTPIYYVNDRPHIGHCFTTLVADVAARYERLLRGAPAPSAPSRESAPRDVFLLTGTDEHADKVVTSALEHGTTPQAWADRNAAEYERAFKLLGVSNDDFIRTTEARHKERVPRYLRRMIESGDVYQG